jgi:DNA modification methylase
MKIAFQNEKVTLYHGDCREWSGKADAVISDPPYGMNLDTNTSRFTSERHSTTNGKRNAGRHDGHAIANDDKPFDPTPWLDWPKVVLFGMNHFAARLPVGTTLVWIKRKDSAFGTFLSDAELAWMKGGCGVYCKRGPFPQSIARNRVHPAQKPVELLMWCMDRAKVPPGATVLDPYAGSGTTLIAALETGRKAIGIEIDEQYVEVARRRLERWHAQVRLPLTFNADAHGRRTRTVQTLVWQENEHD